MSLNPPPPRNDSAEEKARYASDLKALKENPQKWGVTPAKNDGAAFSDERLAEIDAEIAEMEADTPEPAEKDVSADVQAGNSEPPDGVPGFTPASDAELSAMSKKELENYAKALPNGQDFDPDLRKKKGSIIAEISVRHGNLPLHESG